MKRHVDIIMGRMMSILIATPEELIYEAIITQYGDLVKI